MAMTALRRADRHVTGRGVRDHGAGIGVLGLYGASPTRRGSDGGGALRMRSAHAPPLVQQVLVDGLRLAVRTVAGSSDRSWSRVAGADCPARWCSGDLGVVAAPIVLLTAVAVASVLPARRALAVDPLTIMRASE